MSASDPISRAIQTLASPLAFESDSAWLRAVLDAAARASGADRSHAQWPGQARAVSDSYSEHLMAQYLTYFPLLERVGCFERGQRLGVATRKQTYGPHVEAMQQTEYVREFLPSVRSFDSITITVPHPANGLPVQLLVHQSERGHAFDAKHVEAMRRLRPAFAAGVAVQHQLAKAREDVCALVDSSGGSCALFSMDGRLVHQSRALQDALAREPLRNDLTDATGALAARALASPMQAGATRFSGRRGSYRLSASMGRALRPLLMVTVAAPLAPKAVPPLETLAAQHQLTPRQAEVAALLAERRTNREISEALCVSVHTARHHVAAALSALGVERKDVSAALLS